MLKSRYPKLLGALHSILLVTVAGWARRSRPAGAQMVLKSCTGGWGSVILDLFLSAPIMWRMHILLKHGLLCSSIRRESHLQAPRLLRVGNHVWGWWDWWGICIRSASLSDLQCSCARGCLCPCHLCRAEPFGVQILWLLSVLAWEFGTQFMPKLN